MEEEVEEKEIDEVELSEAVVLLQAVETTLQIELYSVEPTT